MDNLERFAARLLSKDFARCGKTIINFVEYLSPVNS